MTHQIHRTESDTRPSESRFAFLSRHLKPGLGTARKAVAARPLPYAVTMGGLAWLVFGRPRDKAPLASEAIETWEDEGGLVPSVEAQACVCNATAGQRRMPITLGDAAVIGTAALAAGVGVAAILRANPSTARTDKPRDVIRQEAFLALDDTTRRMRGMVASIGLGMVLALRDELTARTAAKS